MGASREMFIKISEGDYLRIDEETRRCHLSSKVVSIEDNDFDELMQDELFYKLYNDKKKVSKSLDDRKYHLRELKRKQNGK